MRTGTQQQPKRAFAAVRRAGRRSLWIVALVVAGIVVSAVSAFAGSPLTLAIIADPSMQLTDLAVGVVREVKCQKDGFPPDVKIVQEKAAIPMTMTKTVYISELSLRNKTQHICFMPAHTVTTTTGTGTAETTTVPAETWMQKSQKLSITMMRGRFKGANVQFAASCTGKYLLDSQQPGKKVLHLSYVPGFAPPKPGSSTKGSKTGAPKLSNEIRIQCQVGPT